jgi:predicted Rossmann fold flavoprotein
VTPGGDRADVAVIGGGAAGLTAAIFAAEAARERHASLQVVLLEGSAQCGTKILVSGGGRCNVTHKAASADDYNGSRHIIRNVLAAFDVAATQRWLASLGVELKEEESGKLFPVSNSAREVRDALVSRCRELGVSLRTGCRVARVLAPGADMLFRIEHGQGVLLARRVILTTGGRSLPRSGSDGAGWGIAKELGHTVTETCQALVPLVLDPGMFHRQLAGITLEVELTSVVDGKRVDRRSGSMLWTHFGISGPVVLDASRHWAMAQGQGRQPQLLCNLLFPDGPEACDRWLLESGAARPRTSMETIVAARLPGRVAIAVLRHAGVDPTTPVGQLPREQRRALVRMLTSLPLPVLGPRGWDYAEVTAGGVPLAEIDYRTLQSRKVPGLYLAGEILDCDGRIGGFNFQWAWATGHLAGRAADGACGCEGAGE